MYKISNGDAIVGLEKNGKVLKAMHSLFMSAPQVLDFMKIVEDLSYFNNENIRVYL